MKHCAHNLTTDTTEVLQAHDLLNKISKHGGLGRDKRLAADFQRAQLSSTAHKLPERNCIEIVQKLISLGLVEVIYTTDGKEYLTPQQLET